MRKMGHRLGLVSGVALLAMCAAGAASAQSSAGGNGSQTSDAADSGQGEVVITGSLIRQPNLTSSSPFTAVSREDFAKQDTTDVQQMLLRSPQVYAGTNTRSGFTPDAGASTLNLRNIGANRTLVLIDGQRLAPTDSNGLGAADINIIPSILIKRVDIVTGGASAAYGSDALGGVVNFVMDRLNGFRADVQAGAYQHDNNNSFIRSAQSSAGFDTADKSFFGGRHIDASFAAGVTSSDDRAHVQAYFDYSHTQPIRINQLDYSGCDLFDAGNSAVCFGSSVTGSANFYSVNGTANSYFLDPANGNLRQFQSSDSYTGQIGYLLASNTRYQAGFMGDMALTAHIKAYATFAYLKNSTAQEVSPAALFGNPVTVSCGNGMLTGQELNLFCGGSTAGTFTTNLTRRNVEGGTRALHGNSNQFRATTGLEADAGAFHFNIHAQYTRAETNQSYENDYSSQHLIAGINNCVDSGGAPVSGCVPYNIFQPGAVTPAAAAYVQASGTFNTLTTEKLASATVNGDLGKLGIVSPWATDGVSIALGAEYREEAYAGHPDYELGSGDLAGYGKFNAISGSYKIKEVFGEARIPLIQDKPLIHDLSAGGAFRVSDYNNFGTTTTYAFSGNYSPTSDVRFRGSYNRAIREPSLFELYSNQGISYANYTVDGCEGASPTYTAAECAHTGVTAAQYGNILAAPPGTYHNGSYGGNPALNPEKASTYSAGVVFTPTFVPGLNLSVDWYSIKISGAISSPPPQTVLDQCAQTGNPFYCNLVHRDPANGSLWLSTAGYVFGGLINAGTQRTAGVDVNSQYGFNTGVGRINLGLVGSYIYAQDLVIVPSAPTTKCAGRFGYTCGAPTPKWHHTLTASWATPWPVDVTAAWRLIGTVNNDTPGISPVSEHIRAQNYFDLTAAYHINKHYTLRIGVNNIFDKDPPIVTVTSASPGTNYNTFPSTYDPFGRSLYAKLSVNF